MRVDRDRGGSCKWKKLASFTSGHRLGIRYRLGLLSKNQVQY